MIQNPVGTGTPRSSLKSIARRLGSTGARSALLDFLDFGVDDVVVVSRLGRRRGRRGACVGSTSSLGRLRCLGVCIHLLAQLLAGSHQRGRLLVNRGLVFAFQNVFQRLHGSGDRVFFARVELVAVFGQALVHAVHGGFALVAGLHQLKLLLVVGGVELGVLHHLLNLFFRQARVGLDGDLVFLARALVLGAYVQDAVGVDVERHFDLWHAARCRWDALEIELAQELVARCHFTFTLVDLDGHGRLVVIGRRVGLCELGRDGRVLLDHLGHHATQGFNAQRQRSHVQQQHVLAVTRQHLALNGGAHGHGFIGVHILAGVLAEEFLDLLLHLGHAGHAAHQDHVMDVGHRHASVLDGHAARSDGAFNQFFHQGFELGTRELDVQVLGARCIGRYVRQVDVGRGRVRQFDLGLFGRFLQALQGQNVVLEVDARFLLELVNDVVDDALVEVFAAQERIAVGGQHFKLLFAVHVGDFDDRHVERAAAQVIYGDLAVALFLLVQAKGQGCCGGFVDDALDVQARNAAGVLGGLALCVVEVRGHGDDGFRHGLAQVVFGGLLHLAQDVGRHLLGRQLVAAHFDPGVAVVGGHDLVGHQVDVLLHFFFGELAADQALDGVQRVLGVGHGLALGRGTDEDLAVFLVGHDGGRGARAFAVFNHAGRVALHDGDAAVGRTQVNADDFSHDYSPNA
ncbi:putative NAD-specific glutamate dehydrogenase encoded in antisense gene pair with dnaKJ [Acidovorax sp. NO-1]|nr:putative NAD-specific glutamate dehydrogenase encoded in antisense gene pair with dnaKJ [Acidovorax sp. NO-1]